jgi:phytoene dehydrogenase-like protein
MRAHDKDAVVVIGAGLAGLTAAATAARAGKAVVVVEAHAGGGRARTDERNGYHFNQGAHALYKGGPAWRILRELGVSHHGHLPPLRGAGGVRDGRLVRLLGTWAGPLTARVLAASPARWAGRSAEEWAQSLGRSRDVSDLARTLIRVSTYAADLPAMPAGLAISQVKLGLTRGVSYLDGGWESLVDGLWSAAWTAGARVLSDGEVLPAAAVIIAAGSPAVAAKLLPVDPGWPDPGPPVTAACLDLGLRGHHPPLVFGLDEPLYLSPHCPPGDLAPDGGAVVHVMRYGARDPQLDRAQLRQHARVAGITDGQIVEERFLAGMVVTHLLPRPEQGLAGRPAVAVPGAQGLYLAGDWVGPSGWLADAAMASGQRAGLLAARAPAEERSYPRVA